MREMSLKKELEEIVGLAQEGEVGCVDTVDAILAAIKKRLPLEKKYNPQTTSSKVIVENDSYNQYRKEVLTLLEVPGEG